MDRTKIQNPAGQLASPIENKYKENENLLFENRIGREWSSPELNGQLVT